MDKDVLASLVAERLTTRELAERLGCSQTTVRYWLGQHGLRVARSRGVPAGVEADIDRTIGDCPMHGESDFVRRADGAWRCCRCRSEAVTARRRRVKAILVAEAGGACLICGYDRWPGALQFHHLDPATKSFHLSLKGLTRAIDNVREEAKKCVLLCANCHAEVEGGVAAVPPTSIDHIRG